MQMPEVSFVRLGKATTAAKAFSLARPVLQEMIRLTKESGLEHGLIIRTPLESSRHAYVEISPIYRGDMTSCSLPRAKDALAYIHTHPACTYLGRFAPSRDDLKWITTVRDTYGMVINCRPFEESVCTFYAREQAKEPTEAQWKAPLKMAEPTNDQLKSLLRLGPERTVRPAHYTRFERALLGWGFPASIHSWDEELKLPNDLLEERLIDELL